MKTIAKTYHKVVAAVVLAVLGWAQLVVNSKPEDITANEWIAGGSMLVVALGIVPSAVNQTAPGD